LQPLTEQKPNSKKNVEGAKQAKKSKKRKRGKKN
jgi:hypothetical protein